MVHEEKLSSGSGSDEPLAKAVNGLSSAALDGEKGDLGDGLAGQPMRLDPYGIPLQPTPTEDRRDPLNWSRTQKYTILFIVCYATFLAVYMTGTSIEAFFLLETQFDATYSQVNWTFAIPSLGLAVGPLLFNSLADSHGRRLVLLVCTAIAILASGCTTIRGLSYGGYMFFRFLQGIGGGPPVAIGFSIIRDFSWEHERGFNVGIWVMALDIGGVLGALVGGFTATTGTYWANYHVAIAYAVLLLLEIFCLPETLYPRDQIVEMTDRGEDISLLKCTKDLKPWSVAMISGVPHPRPQQAVIRFVKSWAHPRLLLALLPYVFLEYWWICSYLTMLPAAYENYSTQIQGVLFVGLMLGTILAELLVSGRLSDILTSRMARRNNNVRTPEMRIYLGYPGAVLAAVGCIIWGISIDRNWHWITGQVAFVLSFIEPWIINYWVDSVGYTWCFVTQGLITLLLIPAYALLQWFGPRLEKDMIFD
ncbi:major facilitator superfamily transporter [Grosmannia clavigera kw1407]|uniref:Major facilitator superfamily transporter n=1 Tax=Grosmannia clavigera (strain kw1407 / UAMH 11150) TaxID=655863 RepID=F0XF83_GROCL|nr:major facilitator superfamily transporter [Grosmannia clavigera kw1407]EFX03943.1 major facilitator superfamily transporter [Grosmannia clavigera kw1407]